MSKITHRPSGSMCQVCMLGFIQNCSYLPFNTMPVMKTDKDGVKVVKCSEFSKIPSKK